MHRQVRRPAPAGFTLVELLIVIIIIGLLTGMLTLAIGKAMISAREARVVAEINQLNTGVIKLKEEKGSYPPTINGAPPAAYQLQIMAYLRRAYPRAGFTTYALLKSGLTTSTASMTYPSGGLDLDTMDPAESLVFWMSGIPGEHTSAVPSVFTSSTKMYGFSLNPLSPLAPPVSATEQRTPPLYPFDQLRLLDADGDGWLEYYPTGPANPPYVYFDSRSYAVIGNAGSAALGFASPYQNSATAGGFMNPDTFQIIAAGEDQSFGASVVSPLFKQFPSGANWGPEDNDNLTNFAKGRLEESKP